MDTKISKISEWINEQGYPLEMYCENILSLNNFSVRQRWGFMQVGQDGSSIIISSLS
jgi:hypothetical protein